jgi:ATP-dependent Clp protease ATP-binding subunit ClpA
MSWFEMSDGSCLWRFVRILLSRGYRFDLYSDDALRALAFARDSESESGGTALLPGHVLPGRLQCDPALVQRLSAGDSQVDGVATEILRQISKSESLPMSAEIPYSRAARRVLQTAGREASDSHSRVSLEHLLIGLLRNGGSAGELLQRNGMRQGDVRASVRHSSGGATET